MKIKSYQKLWQVSYPALLFLILIVSTSVIYLGATVFRPHIPIFRLIDNNVQSIVKVNPELSPNPGVIDLSIKPTVRLYMVLGSDFRPQAGYRTDIIMLVALDTLTGKVSLVSFPRDLWVSIPGYGEQRLNTVMQLGGFQLLADTMQTNFGLYPTDYAMINLQGFMRVIDVLGGVEINTDYFTADACDSSLDADSWCEITPGRITLDSDWALWYVRARYNSSDFDRMRRTQEVVEAVMRKVLSPVGVGKLASLIEVYESEVETNISLSDLFPLLRLAFGFNLSDDVQHYSIGLEQVTPWVTTDSASVLLPDFAVIQSVLLEALNLK